MATIKNLIALTRPANVIMVGFAVCIGALCAYPWYHFPLGLALVCAVSLALLAAWGNVHNDLLDMDADAKAHPERALVSGSISEKTARIFARSLLALSAFTVGMMPVRLMVVWTVLVFVLYIYNVWLKSLPLLGNSCVAFLCAIPVTMVDWNPYPKLTLAPAILAFAATLIREILKDVQDIQGDQIAGRRTAPIAWGIPSTQKIVYGCIALLFAMIAITSIGPLFSLNILPLPSKNPIASYVYIGIAAIPSVLLMLYSITTIQKLVWKKSQQIYKIILWLGLLGFLGSAFLKN